VSRYYSYLATAVTLLSQYQGKEPFAAFLKKYFASHKKHGSRDRKQISHLCYCYFRTAHALKGGTLQDQVLQALLLCSQVPVPLLEELHPEWSAFISLAPEEKIAKLDLLEKTAVFFPWLRQLSEGLDKPAFNQSFLVQPDTFIRVRPGYTAQLEAKLMGKGVAFKKLSPDCFSFPPGTNLDELLLTNKEAVIQDFSSQQVGPLLEGMKKDRQAASFSVWDCCAASGGKSIMVKDWLGAIKLTVSDIRESILHNLKKRFSEAGIGNFHTLVADLAVADPLSPGDLFDLVIADVPCSGSGTWGRTPEQLFYFNEKKIAEYQQLQQRILRTVLPHVKPGGYLLYITCSVFRQENEEQVAFISRDKTFTLIRQECLKGYDEKADTIFAAVFRKYL